jgi:hypothetical protein
MGRKKKEKKPIVGICGYCKYFREADSKSANVEAEGSKTVHSRKCVLKKETVRDNDPACENFELYQYFWCDRDNSWLDVRVCMGRLEKGICVRCKQGKFLKEK